VIAKRREFVSVGAGRTGEREEIRDENSITITSIYEYQIQGEGGDGDEYSSLPW